MTMNFATSPPKNPVALVVDDVHALRFMMSACLTQAGFDVVTLSEGKDALETAKRIRPNLICLDVMLPDICGIELCYSMRGEEETAKTPILVTSARSTPQDRANAELAGANDYLMKPFSPVTLAATARSLVRGQSGA